MNQSQIHRGPDDGGLHVEPGVGLAHRRLSIIDLSGGHQPLFNEDGSVVVVYNGEIYNFPELTTELLAAGHHFRTHCDTEVIVHAWEEWGEECVDPFRGMFAFAIWDRNRRHPVPGPRPPGHQAPVLRPAARRAAAVRLGAQVPARSSDGLPRKTDPRSVEDYFAYGYVPEPQTIFSGCLQAASRSYPDRTAR